jgi:hypothetical protein
MSTHPADPAPQSISDEVHNGVRVIHVCQLLDAMYGVNGWMGMDHEIWGKAMVEWVNRHDACYHSWEGPSYMRLAERDNGLRKAWEAKKTVLVIEALS